MLIHEKLQCSVGIAFSFFPVVSFHACVLLAITSVSIIAQPFLVSITLKNPYGYLDAADYPIMVFYIFLLAVYVFLAVVWCILLCCYYKDLVRLQVCVHI